MPKKKIIPLLLSGGSGSRLWPLSRKHFPKQFIPLIKSQSLFNQTLERLMHFGEGLLEDPMIVSNIEYESLILKELASFNNTNFFSIYEPLSRNTAAAMTVSCLEAMRAYGDEAYILSLPADHLIEDQLLFKDSVLRGIELAEEESVIFFGI